MLLQDNKNIVSYSIFGFILLYVFAIGIILMNTFHGDPSIYYVYAKNIAAGDFFSFNPNEFSSGSTSPLWAIILSPAFLLSNSTLIVKIICLIFTLLAIILCCFVTYKISNSLLGSSFSLFLLLYYLIFPGLLSYESSLNVILITLLIYNTYNIIKKFEIRKDACHSEQSEESISHCHSEQSEESISSCHSERSEEPISSCHSERSEEPISSCHSERSEEPISSCHSERSEESISSCHSERSEESISAKSHNTWKLYFIQCLLYATIPLSRPDSSVIVAITFIILFVLSIKSKKNIATSIIIIIIAMIPAALYFGYSYFILHSFSTSSFCRSFALGENAPSISGIKFSLAVIEHFLSLPFALWVGFSLWAWIHNKEKSPIRYLGIILFLSLIAYFIFTSLLSPIAEHPDRYLIPIIPVIIPLGALGFEIIYKKFNNKEYKILIYIIIVIIAFYPLTRITMQLVKERSRTASFDVIAEKNIVDYINQIAESNSYILSYEVQNRYYLRQDLKILSLDGIIDGKVAPYLKSGDMTSFLKKFKPRYWLANDAVEYRNYLKNSILSKVVRTTGNSLNSSIEISGIKFTNIKISNEPIIQSFASYKQLYKLEYKKNNSKTI